MPYSPENPPDKIKDLSEKKQRQWVHVFNSCWERHKDEGKCHAMAWGSVKKSSYERISRNVARKFLSSMRTMDSGVYSG